MAYQFSTNNLGRPKTPVYFSGRSIVVRCRRILVFTVRYWRDRAGNFRGKDEGYNSGGGFWNSTFPCHNGGLQTAPPRIRQAYDLLPAGYSDVCWHSRHSDYHHAPGPAPLRTLAG